MNTNSTLSVLLVALVATTATLRQDPPPPSPNPFPRMDKAELAVRYMQFTESIGWSPVYAMAYAAYAVGLQSWQPRDGWGPILARIP